MSMVERRTGNGLSDQSPGSTEPKVDPSLGSDGVSNAEALGLRGRHFMAITEDIKANTSRRSIAQYLALAYIASVPFDGLQLGTRSAAFVASVAFLAAVSIDKLVRRTPRRVLTGKVVAGIVGLGMYAASSYVWSINSNATFERLPAIALILAVSLCLPSYLRTVWKQACWGYCISSTVLTVAVLSAPANQYSQRRTASGNENDVATVLAIAACLALYLAFDATRHRIAAIGLAIAAFSMVGIVATGSRTGIVAVIAGLAIVLLQALTAPRAALLARVVMVVAIGATTAYTIPPQYVPDRLISTASAASNEDLSGRVELWDAALNRGLDALGLGLGASQTYFITAANTDHVAHNVVIEVMLELGLIGLILFGIIFWAAIRAIRNSVFRRTLVPLLIVFAIMSTTLSLEWRRITWMVLAFAFTMNLRTKATDPQ
jgi:O-antigen ligase